LPPGASQGVEHALDFAHGFPERDLVVFRLGVPCHGVHGAQSVHGLAGRCHVGRHGRVCDIGLGAPPERVAGRVRPSGDLHVEPLRDVRGGFSEVPVSARRSGHVHIADPFCHVVPLLAEVRVGRLGDLGVLGVRRRRKVAEQRHV
jgi:hypothetical protein